MNVGFILPDGSKIEVPYEQLNLLVSKLIELHRDSLDYQEFIKDYKTINPDFYYLIFKLGYKVINPFQKQDSIGYGINNVFVIKRPGKSSLKYLAPTDKNLEINKLDSDTLEDAIVMPDMTRIKILDKDDGYLFDIGHEQIADIIFNDLLIKNPLIYDDYIKNKYNDFYYTVMYLINVCGCMLISVYETGYGNIIYNPKLENVNFEKITADIAKKYPNVKFIDNNREQQKAM